MPIPERAPRAGWWPWAVPALLLLNIGICGVTVYLAVGDPAFATEPDYYRKALHWDADAAARRGELDLGWKLQVHVASVATDAHERTLRVLLHDRDGRPITDAEVSIEAFAHTQARERQTVALAAHEAGYEGVLRIGRTGLWEVRVKVTRGKQAITATRLLEVAPALECQP